MAGLAVLVVAGFVSSSSGQTDLKTLQAIYKKECDKIDNKLLTSLLDARYDYPKQLEAMEKVSIKKGDLEGVLAVRKEKKRFGENKTVSKDDLVESPAELRVLQEQVVSLQPRLKAQSKMDIARLSRIYVQRLDELKKDLTRQGRLDEGLAVKAEVDNVNRIVDFGVLETAIPAMPEKAGRPAARVVPVNIVKFNNFDFEKKWDGWKRIGSGGKVLAQLGDGRSAHQGKYAYQSCQGSGPIQPAEDALTNELVSTSFTLFMSNTLFSAWIAGGSNGLYVGLFSADDDSELCRLSRDANGGDWLHVEKPLQVPKDGMAYIKIVDANAGSWGHIGVDEIKIK